MGTDPNNADTDGDGYSDALEVGSYGTDPLDPASNPAVITRLTITSPSSGTIIADNLPNFVGATKPDARILLLLAPGPKSREHLAGGRANEAGTFSIKPARPLTSSGSFNFVIAVIDEDAVVIEESPLVRVNINLQPLERVTTQAALQAKIKSFADVNLPAGAERTSALDAEIGDNQPVISGQVPQGSTVIFIWESLLFTSTVIADTTTGEFSIRPPQALPDGQHKVTFYMVKDDVRGPAAVYDFFISEKARQEGGSIRRIPVLAAAGPQIALQQITLINSLINFFQESVWGWIALGAVVLLLVIFLVIRIRRRRLGQNNTPASAI